MLVRDIYWGHNYFNLTTLNIDNYMTHDKRTEPRCSVWLTIAMKMQVGICNLVWQQNPM